MGNSAVCTHILRVRGVENSSNSNAISLVSHAHLRLQRRPIRTTIHILTCGHPRALALVRPSVGHSARATAPAGQVNCQSHHV